MTQPGELGPDERRAIQDASYVARGQMEAQVDLLALRHYAANGTWTALCVVLAVLTVCSLLWTQQTTRQLSMWAAAVVAAAALHAWLGARYCRALDGGTSVPRLGGVNGSLWVCAGALGFGVLPLLHDAPLADLSAILILFGALGILALSRMISVFAPFIGFSLLALGPPAVAILLRGADSAHGVLAVLGAGALASVAVLLIAHRTLHQALRSSLWMGVEQRSVLRRLQRFNQQLYDDRATLQTESRTDALTGVANRRALEERLESEWSRCRREGNPLSCVMLDIDHFKHFNDHYGHDGGDECLRQIGEVLEGSLRRAGDLAARYGGEEFVLLLPNTDLKGALVVAEQVRRSVAERRIAHAGSPSSPHVTVSVGVASVVPDDSTLLQELPKSADLALYEAKRQGRNRSVGADGQMRDSARMAARGMIG